MEQTNLKSRFNIRLYLSQCATPFDFILCTGNMLLDKRAVQNDLLSVLYRVNPDKPLHLGEVTERLNDYCEKHGYTWTADDTDVLLFI